MAARRLGKAHLLRLISRSSITTKGMRLSHPVASHRQELTKSTRPVCGTTVTIGVPGHCMMAHTSNRSSGQRTLNSLTFLWFGGDFIGENGDMAWSGLILYST